MGRERVAIVRGGEPRRMIRQAVTLAGGWLETVAGAEVVLLKPNLTVPRRSGSGVVTDVRLVEGAIELLKEVGVRQVIVGDGPGGGNAPQAFRVAGYDHLPARYGVELLDLNATPARQVSVPGGMVYDKLWIPEIVLDADAVVSLSVMKTHTDGLVTLTAKNGFGLPPTRFYGTPRVEFHSHGVDRVIHDIIRAVPFDYAVVDALVAMEAGGPIDGHPVALGLVVAGQNTLAVDATCARIMDVDPWQVPHLRYLHHADVGPLAESDIEVVGESIAAVQRPFILPHSNQASHAQLLAVGAA